jgi:hypothetical protein
MGWRAGGSEEWVARRVRAARDGDGGVRLCLVSVCV